MWHARVGALAPAGDAFVGLDFHVGPRAPAAVDDERFELGDLHVVLSGNSVSDIAASVRLQRPGLLRVDTITPVPSTPLAWLRRISGGVDPDVENAGALEQAVQQYAGE